MGVRHTETSLVVWSKTTAVTTEETTPAETKSVLAQTAPSTTGVAARFDADVLYDAGDLGCAYGPLDEIAKMMRSLASGQTMEIHATDPTVAIDLAAWCRMTGHSLVEQQGNHYLVRRK